MIQTGDRVFILEDASRRIIGVFSSEHRAVRTIPGIKTFVYRNLVDHDVTVTEWFAHQGNRTYYVTDVPVSS